MSERSIRVLLVEDEAIVAADLQDQLRGKGLDVVGWTHSGEKALELALKETPDVILMDVRLSGSLDGVSVARRLREVGVRAGIVFLTAYSDGLVRDRVADLERTELLYKPFSQEELLEIVLRFGPLDE